jgi:tetratricopeptide (TPR) repeat protein
VLYARGCELLRTGDIDGAYDTLYTAVRFDPDNVQYREQSSHARQMVYLRKQLKTAQSSAQWLNYANELHEYYCRHCPQDPRMQALTLALEIHSREGSAESAALLARTRLQFGLNSDAAEGLRTVTQQKVDTQLRLLMGIALAREGHTAQAEALLKNLKVSSQGGFQFYYDLARLQAGVGQNQAALKSLTRSFEQTPPSRLEYARQAALECADFARLKEHSNFANVLATESKRSETVSKEPAKQQRVRRPGPAFRP